MVALLVSNSIQIKSHKGNYEVNFIKGSIDELQFNPIKNAIYVVDQNIAQIYSNRISSILNSEKVLIIDATE